MDPVAGSKFCFQVSLTPLKNCVTTSGSKTLRCCNTVWGKVKLYVSECVLAATGEQA